MHQQWMILSPSKFVSCIPPDMPFNPSWVKCGQRNLAQIFEGSIITSISECRSHVLIWRYFMFSRWQIEGFSVICYRCRLSRGKHKRCECISESTETSFKMIFSLFKEPWLMRNPLGELNMFFLRDWFTVMLLKVAAIQFWTSMIFQ